MNLRNGIIDDELHAIETLVYDLLELHRDEVDIEFDIKLKKGLNLVQYQLGSIYKTDPDIRASFPSKVKITGAGENPQIVWMAKYFY